MTFSTLWWTEWSALWPLPACCPDWQIQSSNGFRKFWRKGSCGAIGPEQAAMSAWTVTWPWLRRLAIWECVRCRSHRHSVQTQHKRFTWCSSRIANSPLHWHRTEIGRLIFNLQGVNNYSRLFVYRNLLSPVIAHVHMITSSMYVNHFANEEFGTTNSLTSL